MNVGLERLSENSLKVSDWIPPTREALARLRLRALRRGVWFRELKVSERTLIDLVIRIVDKVRSRILAKLLSHIVSKLLDAMEGEVSRLIRTKGRNLAQKLSYTAQSWGNKSAVEWTEDQGFIRYLVISQICSG